MASNPAICQSGPDAALEKTPEQSARTVIMSRVEVLALARELDRPAPQVPPIASTAEEEGADTDEPSIASQLWKAAEGVILGVLVAAAGTAMIAVISAVLMMAAISMAP